MIKRIFQFYRALTAHLTKEDKIFVKRYLSPAEQELFDGMHIYDQLHVLNVAYTAIKMAGADYGDKDLLIKAALLHDVGRQSENICLWDKVLLVLLNRFCPGLLQRIAQKGAGGFIKKRRNALYVCINHAAIGYGKLAKITDKNILEIIKHHHDEPQGTDSKELILLRRADEEN